MNDEHLPAVTGTQAGGGRTAHPAAVSTPAVIPPQAERDEQLLALWLFDRPEETRRAYAADVRGVLAHTGTTIQATTLGHVQGFVAALGALAPASRGRKLSAVKSLFGFAHRLGYVPFNVAAPVRQPAVKHVLAERIIAEVDVHRLLALEANPRNRALLAVLYIAGVRISEAAGLCWRDAQPRDDAGQLTVFGKGGRTRAVLLPRATWALLAALRGEAAPDAPMFRSRRGSALDASQVHRVVKAAAKRAGLPAEVSAHWLRHAHASHALDRGAPVHLVQATLGHASVATTGRYLHARPTDSSAKYLAG